MTQIGRGRMRKRERYGRGERDDVTHYSSVLAMNFAMSPSTSSYIARTRGRSHTNTSVMACMYKMSTRHHYLPPPPPPKHQISPSLFPTHLDACKYHYNYYLPPPHSPLHAFLHQFQPTFSSIRPPVVVVLLNLNIIECN